MAMNLDALLIQVVVTVKLIAPFLLLDVDWFVDGARLSSVSGLGFCHVDLFHESFKLLSSVF